MSTSEDIKTLFDELYPPGTAISAEEAWTLLRGPISSVASVASRGPTNINITEQFSAIVILASEFKSVARSAVDETFEILEKEKARRLKEVADAAKKEE